MGRVQDAAPTRMDKPPSHHDGDGPGRRPWVGGVCAAPFLGWPRRSTLEGPRRCSPFDTAFMIPVFLSLLAAATFAADTTRYVVLNHGRPAGQMTVVRDGDSVIVHYRHVDR